MVYVLQKRKLNIKIEQQFNTKCENNVLRKIACFLAVFLNLKIFQKNNHRALHEILTVKNDAN